jgi:ribonuclease PH
MAITRHDGRMQDRHRPLSFELDWQRGSLSSVLVSLGNTRVLCAVSCEDNVPPWMRGRGTGWVTAEYNMLPGAGSERVRRERRGAGGRTMEIQRLIGRSLRAVTDLSKLGERSLTVDCDVIDADGGTRTASITGAAVALWLAADRLKLPEQPMARLISAVSVGVVEGHPVLDLDYKEDSGADVDMNLVMDERGRFVEVQGSGEEATFSREELDTLLALGEKGCAEFVALQREVLGL